MSDDPHIKKSEFENIVCKLLHSQPLPEKQVHAKKQKRPKHIVPGRQNHPSKPHK